MQIELIKFLEKFLPEYEEVKTHYLTEESFEMYCSEFPKAMQNFADRICEKQRENCGDKVWDCISDIGWDDVGESTIENYILTAKQPKIEEL